MEKKTRLFFSLLHIHFRWVQKKTKNARKTSTHSIKSTLPFFSISILVLERVRLGPGRRQQRHPQLRPVVPAQRVAHKLAPSRHPDLLQPAAHRAREQVLVPEPRQLARELDPVRERGLVQEQRDRGAGLVPVRDARGDSEKGAEGAAGDGVDGLAEAGAGRGRGAGLGKEVVDEAAADVVAPKMVVVVVGVVVGVGEKSPEGRERGEG